jgi:hypothetical protein
MAEGGEPLPRTPAIWGQLRYEVNGAVCLTMV